MGISGVMWVSILFQTLIGAANIKFGRYKLIRKAQPETIQDLIVLILVIGSAIMTAAKKPIYPFSLPAYLVAIILFVVGASAPLLGLTENHFKKSDSEIFAKNRFWGHLGGNCAGAAVATLFFWAAQRVSGFSGFTHCFRDASAFNFVLPLTTIIVFAFIRQQQVVECADMDKMVAADQDWASKIRGYSLSDWNQFGNCLFLIFVNFVGASTILYLFSFTLLEAKAGAPVQFSVQMALAMIALIVFLLICGSPLSWENRAVYFTFLTGMPGVLIAAMVWLALLAPSFWRNIFAVSFVGIGYALYCGTVVLGALRRSVVLAERGSAAYGQLIPVNDSGLGDTIELYYFAAAILGVALAILLGVLYLTHSGAC